MSIIYSKPKLVQDGKLFRVMVETLGLESPSGHGPFQTRDEAMFCVREITSQLEKRDAEQSKKARRK
jgi:hypothetical protein